MDVKNKRDVVSTTFAFLRSECHLCFLFLLFIWKDSEQKFINNFGFIDFTDVYRAL